MERYILVAQTQKKPQHVIVLVSRTQKSDTRDNNFVKWRGTKWWTKMIRPVKVDHLQSCSRIFQSDQTKMDYSIWSTNRNFRNFGFNGNKAPPWTDPLSGGYEGLPWQRYIQVIYPTTFSCFLLKFCHTLLTNLTNIKPKTVENKILVEFKIYCVVPENIHTPTMEGTGNL